MSSNQPKVFAPPRNVQQLIQVALGQEKADLAVINANLVNVYTGEVLPRHAVCIKEKWIAYVGQNPDPSIDSTTEVIDAESATLIPGLIDGHTHLAMLMRVDEFLRYAAVGGTTTMVTETLEAYPVAGLNGVMAFIDSFTDQPIKILATAPYMASISQRSRGVSLEDLRNILDRPEIIGLGESYWQSLIQEPEKMAPILDETYKTGKRLEGHSAGASERKLNAYLSAGITSCHEPIRAGEVLERLRLGLHVMVREGSIRRDLEEIARITDSKADLRRLVLATDGLSPEDLLEKGCMEFVVQKAIDSGFDPVTAIRMATLNVAEHFGLDGLIGGIAPGRMADMAVIPDIRNIKARVVISNGKVIARNGRLIVEPRLPRYSEEIRHSIRLPRPLTENDFIINIDSKVSTARVRVIEMVTDLVTREIQIELPIKERQLKIDPGHNLLKVAAIDRYRGDGRMFVGLIKKFGLQRGALACSTAWDSADIVVIGTNESDMAAAVNRIRDIQGGAVVCLDGSVKAEVALPIFGFMPEVPIQATLSQLNHLKETLASLGVSFPDPLLTLSTLTGAAIPYLRICEEGLVNLKDGKTLGLVVDE